MEEDDDVGQSGQCGGGDSPEVPSPVGGVAGGVSGNEGGEVELEGDVAGREVEEGGEMAGVEGVERGSGGEDGEKAREDVGNDGENVESSGNVEELEELAPVAEEMGGGEGEAVAGGEGVEKGDVEDVLMAVEEKLDEVVPVAEEVQEEPTVEEKMEEISQVAEEVQEAIDGEKSDEVLPVAEKEPIVEEDSDEVVPVAEKAKEELIVEEKANEVLPVAEKAEKDVMGENSDEVLPVVKELQEKPIDGEKADEVPPVSEKAEEEAMCEEKADEVPPVAEKAEEEQTKEEVPDEVLAVAEKAEEDLMDEEKADEVVAVAEKAEEELMDEEKADEVLPVVEKAEEGAMEEQKADEVVPVGEKAQEELMDEDKADEVLQVTEKSEEEAMDEEKPDEVVPVVEKVEEAVTEEKVESDVEKAKVEEEGPKEVEEDKVEEMVHSPVVTKDEEEEEEEETPTADAEMETESEPLISGSGSGDGKKKRGRKPKAATPVKTPPKKIVGEDVCFICLDGGDLVLCDRRGCPKAYHPSCVDHDAEFFQTKGRWNCGWHLCNNCAKNAYFMCYTCTFSLCKGCSKDAVIFCIRGNKGFCESCMKTVMMIESSEQNKMDQDAFNDYLFKDYWNEQKGRLCITSDELAQAKNPLKDSEKHQKVPQRNNDAGADSDSTLEKGTGSGKRKSKRKLKSPAKEAFSDSEHSSQDTTNKRGKRARRLSKSRSASAKGDGTSAEGNIEWASKDLLEFVMLMNNGDRSVLTQFDVQGLLLEYIKRNKLRDPRRQSQIICDSMLQKLFGKPRVGHFEMLKLLESHFLLKEDPHGDNRGVVDTEMSQLDADDSTDFVPDSGKSRGRKSRKRGEDRGSQSNLDDYAAIDMHNINLIFLRRNLMEALMGDSETFHDKVVGSFVRIRISGSTQKQDIYRLVQIIGTSKASEPYKIGKRTTDVMLEILNLDKTEIISIDIISNQEFTEDECKRLRQSIKCGLISRMTVGDVLEKARELQEVRVTDWLEAEIVRLSHLRDRASEKGRKKELRECVEKLQLLKTPEERQRRLDETPEVHADPKMDPSCESEEEKEETDIQVSDTRPRERRGRDQFSSRKGGAVSSDSWSANARPPNRNLSGKGFSSRREDTAFASPTHEHSWNNGVDKGTPRSNSWEKPRLTSDPLTSKRAEISGVRSDMSASTVPESPRPQSTVLGQTDSKVSETEKTWHYRDPTGKVQGPFSMSQLRKWSNTGFFPADLRIWKASEIEDNSFLLTEALAGRFPKELPSLGLNLDATKHSGNASSSETGGRYDTFNLPSPTPGRSSFQSTSQLRGGIERLPSPTPTSPASDPTPRSNFSHQSKGVAGNKEEIVTPSAGAMQHAAGQIFSTAGTRTNMSGAAQQIASQPTLQMGNQQFTPSNSVANQANVRPSLSTAGQGYPNVGQPGTGQNSSAYTHGWASGYVARPDTVNANPTPSNPNAVPAQVTYGQWTGAPVNNQAPSYGAGYPAAPGNMGTNFQAMPPQNPWRPAPVNLQWGGQQQPAANQSIGWVGQPSGAAFGASAGTAAGAMAPQASSMPGASATPAGTTTMGWSGAGSNPSTGNTNPSWTSQPGNAGGRGGDQNRNGGGGQWGRQSSFGGGGHRVCKFHETGHCKKGASCDYMHN